MTDYRYAHLEFELGGLGLSSPKEPEVFHRGYDYAMNHEKMEEYKANLWVNQYCAEDIDTALAAYPNDPQQAYEKVAQIYGNERIATVLNVSIEAREQMPSFENFSQETLDWGKQYAITGASAPKYLLPLESSKRPPLLLTDTATLEKFVEIVRQNELAQNREPIQAVPQEHSQTLPQPPIIAAPIPKTAEVVKFMAVKDIVANMPTPEMMKFIEQQLMNHDLDELQKVYPHVFPPVMDAEPERTARAEKIVAELAERSPITTADFPQVFDEVFARNASDAPAIESPAELQLSYAGELARKVVEELNFANVPFESKIDPANGKTLITFAAKDEAAVRKAEIAAKSPSRVNAQSAVAGAGVLAEKAAQAAAHNATRPIPAGTGTQSQSEVVG